MSKRIPTYDRPQYKNLVSPAPDRDEPIFNWHAFKHSFSKSLVDDLVKELGLRKSAWVLDPFCGGGTTLLASKLLGIHSKGFDILPFSVFLTNVKTRDYNLRELLDNYSLLKTALKSRRRVLAKLPSDIRILDNAFPMDVRTELLRIKTCINALTEEKNRDFFGLAFLSILETTSRTSKAGGFLRIVERRIDAAQISDVFLRQCSSMIADLEAFESKIRKQMLGTAIAELGDARRIQTDQVFDAIITSPPYPNRHDYTRIYALEMAFDFVRDNDELKKIRYETLRSHVEAREKYVAVNYEQPKELTTLIHKIENNGLNNSNIPAMIRGYFEDMYLCISQMKENLRRTGKIALVVSNVRFSGVNIPVDTLLARIGLSVGLKSVKVLTARRRGNSAQQMRDYSRETSRESIVVWNNN